jgi:Leucine-rich repeat (LRR) protein
LPRQVLPESFGRLKMLTDLYVSENKFTEFPVEVTGMLSLQKLSLACNDISVIPPEIANLEDLRFLDMSFNQVRRLFFSVSRPQVLLSLAERDPLFRLVSQIRQLPAELASLCNLERLNLAFNPLGSRSPELPEVIFKVTTLIELNLDYTGIQV